MRKGQWLIFLYGVCAVHFAPSKELDNWQLVRNVPGVHATTLKAVWKRQEGPRDDLNSFYKIFKIEKLVYILLIF